MKRDEKCSLCGFVVFGNDSLMEHRKMRHEGRHDPRKKIGLIKGKVYWLPV